MDLAISLSRGRLGESDSKGARQRETSESQKEETSLKGTRPACTPPTKVQDGPLSLARGKFTVTHLLRRKGTAGDQDNKSADGVTYQEEIEVDGRLDDHVVKWKPLVSREYIQVHLGQDKTTKQLVAIKEVLLRSPMSIAQEVDLLRELQHNNIMALQAVYAADHSVALVMELMALDLHRLTANRAFPFGESLELTVMFEVLQGLDYLHRKKIVHSDIKPDNILVSASLPISVKIADFGLSYRTEAPPTAVHGTHRYMAPESVRKLLRLTTNCDPQSSKEDDVGPPCDLWALGITILGVATGHLPLGNIPLSAFYHRVQHMDVFPLDWELSSVGERRGREWMDVVGGCLLMNTRLRCTADVLLQHRGFQGRASLEQLRQYLVRIQAKPKPPPPQVLAQEAVGRRRPVELVRPVISQRQSKVPIQLKRLQRQHLNVAHAQRRYKGCRRNC